MSEWRGALGRVALDEADTKVWTGAVQALNGKGWFIEGEVEFFAKDVIRANRRGVKIRLRKRGYDGPGLEYIERNIDGVNGYALYCRERADRAAVDRALETSIRKQLS